MIVIAGRGPVAIHGLRLFHTIAELRPDLELRVVAVPGGGDHGGRGAPSMRSECATNGWSVEDDLDRLPLGADDVLLSLQWDQKVLARHRGAGRALNLHFAALPRHRGSGTAYWPVLGRDPEVGVSLHEITDGFDEGPVVAQLRHPLAPFVSSGHLTDLFHRLGAELLDRHAMSILEGSYHAVPQGPSPDPTHRRRDADFSALAVDGFDRAAADVRARCLALVAPDHQLPTFEGRPVEDAWVVPVAPSGPPGQVLARQASTVAVACADGVVVLQFAGATPVSP